MFAVDDIGGGSDACACRGGRTTGGGCCWKDGGGYAAPGAWGDVADVLAERAAIAAAIGANAPSYIAPSPTAGGNPEPAPAPTSAEAAAGAAFVSQPAACAARVPCVKFGIASKECGVTGFACGAVDPGAAKMLPPSNNGEPVLVVVPEVGAQMLEMEEDEG